MKKSDLKKIEHILEEERDRIVRELSSLGHRNPQAKDTTDFITEYKNMGDDVDDNASEVAQYTNELSIEQELEHVLADVEKAIARIHDGSYGKCKYCGDEIDIKRLEIRPTSSSCIACKKTFTKEA